MPPDATPLVAALARHLGEGRVLTEPEDLAAYSYDGTATLRQDPACVVFPKTTAEVAACVRAVREHQTPIVTRGSGTGLSGGSVPSPGSIVLCLADMNRVLDVDARNLTVEAEAGAITQAIDEAAARHGLFYPPDPGSRKISTIGGNVAENAGGLRGLKYGVTRDYVLGLEAVLARGETVWLGNKCVKDVAGYNLRDLFIGSEGTLGIVTRVLLKLIPLPAARRTLLASFASIEAAGETVSDIIAARIIPCTLEFLDQTTVRCVEDYAQVGLPTHAAAILLMETDGHPAAVADEAAAMGAIATAHGAIEVRAATDAADAARLLTARRSAFAALARVRPTTILEDVTVPRSELAAMVGFIAACAARHNLQIGTFGHMGDGNLHPTFLTDERDADEMHRVELALGEIVDRTLAVGGTVTGEHGVGLAKKAFLRKQLGDASYELLKLVKQALDPEGLLNPGKIFDVDARNHSDSLPSAGTGAPSTGDPQSPERRWYHSRSDGEGGMMRVHAADPPSPGPSPPTGGERTDQNQNLLRALDYSVLQQCMHCGMCLPTCPTYDETRRERSSPRGRIRLMRDVADGRREASAVFADEMSYCLGCLACQTACPASVDYATLFETARAEVERSDAAGGLRRRTVRWMTLGVLFRRPRLLRVLGRAMSWYVRSGLQSTMRRSEIMRLIIPDGLFQLEAKAPQARPPFSHERIRPREWPERSLRCAALLTGCVQDLAYPHVNRATVDVLVANGCEVSTPPRQYCCGSLHAHNGELELARDLARRNLDMFDLDEVDAIISNSGGCGSHLKHFGKLLADDQRYRDRARAWDAKVRDIHEWLIEIDFRPPRATNETGDKKSSPMKVAYDASCHLLHGQKIAIEPLQVLRAIPGVELVELAESDWCCGAAGIYMLTQPDQSAKLLKRKLDHIAATGADVVATGNPGCMLQLEQGFRGDSRLKNVRVCHPVELLAEAYRREAVSEHASQQRDESYGPTR